MNFENKGKWLKEAIDDDSDSIFSDKPLDEIDEDEEKVFVRNMSTGNSYYINQSNFDKDNAIVKNGKYYHKKHGYELELKDGTFHKADVTDNAQTRAINKETIKW